MYNTNRGNKKNKDRKKYIEKVMQGVVSAVRNEVTLNKKSHITSAS